MEPESAVPLESNDGHTFSLLNDNDNQLSSSKDDNISENPSVDNANDSNYDATNNHNNSNINNENYSSLLSEKKIEDGMDSNVSQNPHNNDPPRNNDNDLDGFPFPDDSDNNGNNKESEIEQDTTHLNEQHIENGAGHIDTDIISKINEINGDKTDHNQDNPESMDITDDIINDINSSSNSNSNSHSTSVEILGERKKNEESIEILDDNDNQKEIIEIDNAPKESNDDDLDGSILIDDIVDNDKENENENEIEKEYLNNDHSGIGMDEVENENNKKQDNNNNEQKVNHDKEEMDIDDEPQSMEVDKDADKLIVNECKVTRKKKPAKKSMIEKNKTQNVQQTDDKVMGNNTHNISERDMRQFGLQNYNEDEDEDYDEHEEEEEDGDDDENEGSENLSGEDDDEFNEILDDLADIDIVHDDKIYTEEAPRWTVSIDEYKEFNVEEAYQNWEYDKERYGTIYDDAMENDDEKANEDENDDNRLTKEGFFNNLLSKYTQRLSQDPDKDKDKENDKNAKSEKYDLSDKFIDDGDCFEQNGVRTVHSGFFIAKGNIDVIRPHSNISSPTKPKAKSRRYQPKTKLPDVPRVYQEKIERIRDAIKHSKDEMEPIYRDRFMNGITKNKSEYMKFYNFKSKHRQTDIFINQNYDIVHNEKVLKLYSSLLLVLLEFDMEVLRDSDLNAKLKSAIYKELSQVFEWNADESPRTQKNNFANLLDWFSHDWYEDDDDERKSKKMNWRALHIDGVIKNTKSRFQTKLNKVRKNKINDKSEVKDKKSLMEIKYGSSEIPWDTICPDIYQQTVLTMELHAIQDDDIDNGKHKCQSNLYQSLSKYVEGGQTKAGIQMRDIENKYNEHAKNPEFYFSWLVVERIKELQKKKKNKKSKRRKASGSSKKSPKKDLVDLTNTNHINANSNNRSQSDSSSPRSPRNNQRKKNSPSNSVNPIINRMDMIKQDSNPIDLTNDDNHNNNNNNNNSTASTTINNSNRNSPSLTQNTRKRRRHEMSQSSYDELTQDHPSPIQATKRRRIQETNQNATNTNQPRKFKNSLEQGSYIAIHDKRKDCYILSLIASISYKTHRMDVAEWETGAARTNISFKDCYFIIPYQQATNNNNNQWHLALQYEDDNSGAFTAHYKLAKIVERNPLEIRYKHEPETRMIPQHTFISSPKIDDCRDNGYEIPTVIQQCCVVEYLHRNQHQYQQPQQPQQQQRNGHNRIRRQQTYYRAPISCHFIRELPNDPWNDQYFQGAQQS